MFVCVSVFSAPKVASKIRNKNGTIGGDKRKGVRHQKSADGGKFSPKLCRRRPKNGTSKREERSEELLTRRNGEDRPSSSESEVLGGDSVE